jgi:hypothetical protein
MASDLAYRLSWQQALANTDRRTALLPIVIGLEKAPG